MQKNMPGLKNMPKAYIGLVGEKGAGKATFVKLLREELAKIGLASINIGHHEFSKILSGVLRERNLPETRENLQTMAVTLEKEFGKGYLSDRMREIAENDGNDVAVIDGIRWPTDIAMFRSLPNNVLVYITDTTENRFRKTLERKQKAGESETSWETFLKQELAPNEVRIREIGEGAECRIDNPIEEDGKNLPKFREAVAIFIWTKLKILLQAGE